MAETKTAWTHPHLRNLFTSRARQHFNTTKVSFSSASGTIDPIPEKEMYQSGGTITLSTQAIVSMAYGDDISDPTGLGRWSGQTFRGKDKKLFSVITAYRVCRQGSIASAPIGSAFSREYEHFRTNNVTYPRPRKLIIHDLRHLIVSLQAIGHSILLMLDSNGTLEEDQDLQVLQTECDLHDLHAINPAPSTFIGADNRRIDHIFGCSTVQKCMTRSGSLSYLDGPQSDHRGLFVDLNHLDLLGHPPLPNPMRTASSRFLKSGNPALVELYQESMLKYYEDHSMEARINYLSEHSTAMTPHQLRIELEKWDADQGRAMRFVETTLSKPKKPYAWSPTLRDVGLTYRYWRLRLREIQHGADYQSTFDRMEQTIHQHNPTFTFPRRHE